ncbi:MAG: ATP-binding cassette domain-containing protein [Shewanella sp.]|nr:ATP-binding cassette domain-containing protein [Shewanella sp.]MCF1431287.1 ATP-binding cassette domain-containing protein [Shewanella sp.]MCF1437788.1 ATP-binding cassette domain-containing protein [Shewanella sp.]MCF1457897.1 ATP-binding cassette domain-containing protein [Shewanella sp.]
MYRWIGGFLAPYKTRVIAALCFLLLGSLAWLAIGQGVRMLVDQGFSDSSDSSEARLDQVILGLGGIVIVSSIAVFGRFYLMSWLGERVSADIRLTVYRALLTLSPSFYAKARTGEVISRFTSDTTLLENVVGSSFSMALRATVTLLGGLVMMAFTSWKLTALVLVAVPLVVVPAILLGKKVRLLAKRSQDRIADLGAYVDESIHEIYTVQSYGHEAQDDKHFTSHVEAILAAAKDRIFYRALLICLIMSLSFFAILTITWAGGNAVMSGNISAGELSAFMFYAVLIAGAVGTISEVFSEIQRAAGASERLMELAHAVSDIAQPANPEALPSRVQGNLSISNLNFSYPGHSETVLHELSFTVSAGERVALVGASGAGKSTLFALLQHFYPTPTGCIMLDGIASEKLTLDDLRAQFALVPQESVIFATNVLENVRYGRPDASLQEVIDACKSARAHEFISEFPEGYDTYLGERGVRLSGGQKQRIAIARAILADRPILLLDEATSALDARSEVRVKQALDTLMQSKTTLVIAHRLATVVNADRILVLDKGRLVAAGSHEQLLSTCKLYREFASLQLLT